MWHVARAAEGGWVGGDEEDGGRGGRLAAGGERRGGGRRGGGERTGLSVFLMVRLLSVFWPASANLMYGSLVPLFVSMAISPAPSSRCSSKTPSNACSCFVAARLTRSASAAAASASAAAAASAAATVATSAATAACRCSTCLASSIRLSSKACCLRFSASSSAAAFISGCHSSLCARVWWPRATAWSRRAATASASACIPACASAASTFSSVVRSSLSTARSRTSPLRGGECRCTRSGAPKTPADGAEGCCGSREGPSGSGGGGGVPKGVAGAGRGRAVGVAGGTAQLQLLQLLLRRPTRVTPSQSRGHALGGKATGPLASNSTAAAVAAAAAAVAAFCGLRLPRVAAFSTSLRCAMRAS